MATTEHYVKKGVRVKLGPLDDQAGYSIGLAEQEAAALAERGLKAEQTAEAKEIREELRSEASLAVEARTSSKGDTATEEQERTLSKAFGRNLRSALDDLRRDGEITAEERAAFNVPGGRLGQSTPKAIAWLVQITEPLKNVAEKVGPLMGEADVVATHAERLAKLTAAQTTQELSVASLPEDTRRLYELKGRLLTYIEKVNSAGQRRFDGDAVKRAKFNKDILLRGTQTGGAKTPATPEQPAA